MKSFTPPSKAIASRANGATAQRVSQPTNTFVDNRSTAIAQRKLQQAINHAYQPKAGVMQLRKPDAETYSESISWDKKVPVNHASVVNFVNDITNTRGERLGLLNAWNHGLVGRYVIPTPKDLLTSAPATTAPAVVVPSSASTSASPKVAGKRLQRSDSFDMKTRSFDDEIALSTETVKVSTKKAKVDKDVPVVTTMRSAFRLIRAHGRSLKGLRKIKCNIERARKKGLLKGPRFVLKLGKRRGLFEDVRGNDMVFTPLKENTEAGKTGTYLRNGGIFNWTKQGAKLRLYNEKFSKIKDNLIKSLRDEVEPESDEIFDTMGAMACDVKASITGYLECEKKVESTTHDDARKVFHSENTADYEPSKGGGRQLPRAIKKSIKEVEAHTLLHQNNCLINAIALGAGRGVATDAELVSIRMNTNTLGEMLFTSERIIRAIRSILKITRPIIVHYPVNTTDDEIHHGTGGATIHIYHDGHNHFTHTPAGGKKYKPHK